MSDPNDFRQRLELLSGIRQMSVAALRERIEAQFNAELPPEVARQLAEAERRERLREVAEYVLETEVIRLPRQDKLALLEVLYADLFQFGVLDPLLTLPDATEIVIDGAAKINLRERQGAAQLSGLAFESEDAYRRVLRRALNGVALPDETNPFVETGAVLLGRRARLTLAAPPISPHLHTEIRLHPVAAPTRADLIAQGFITETDAETLSTALQQGRGVMIAGDVATGKTTLLQAFLPELPNPSALVERAAEMQFDPATFQHYTGVDFSHQIKDAAASDPAWLVIDELRFDESDALWAVLKLEKRPKLLWVFRGATRADRLVASFGMSLRRSQPAIASEEIVRLLVANLPVVVLCGRKPEQHIGVLGVGEWQIDQADPSRVTLRGL